MSRVELLCYAVIVFVVGWGLQGHVWVTCAASLLRARALSLRTSLMQLPAFNCHIWPLSRRMHRGLYRLYCPLTPEP